MLSWVIIKTGLYGLAEGPTFFKYVKNLADDFIQNKWDKIQGPGVKNMQYSNFDIVPSQYTGIFKKFQGARYQRFKN